MEYFIFLSYIVLTNQLDRTSSIDQNLLVRDEKEVVRSRRTSRWDKSNVQERTRTALVGQTLIHTLSRRTRCEIFGQERTTWLSTRSRCARNR